MCDVTAKQFDSVRSWLRSLRLTEYVDAFQIHGFTTLERLHNLWDVELTSVCILYLIQFSSVMIVLSLLHIVPTQPPTLHDKK